MSRTARVDQVDRRIVAALQRDGRRPFTSIGRELGLSEAAVRQRVARLQAAGIMQVVAVADPMTLGYQAMAMVAISVDGRARKQVAEAVEGLRETETFMYLRLLKEAYTWSVAPEAAADTG